MRKHTFGIVAALCVGFLLCAVSGDVLAATNLTLNTPMISAEALAAIAGGGIIGNVALRGIERKDGGSGGGDLAGLMAEIKSQVGSFMGAFEEFKKTNDERIKQIEQKGSADPLLEQKLAKIEADMAKGEALNQKLTALENEQKKQKDAQDEIEKKLARPRAPDTAEAKIELKQTVNAWARASIDNIVGNPLSDEQKQLMQKIGAEHKSLNVSNDTNGGYLAPTEFVREIIKGVTEITPVRSLVRVRSTTFKSMEIPKRTGQFAAIRVSEQGTRSETDGLRYGLEELSLPEMVAIVDISQQMLEDAAFDMEAEIRMEANEQFSVKEGQEFVSGTLPGQLEGILVNPGVGEYVSGAASAITADGLLLMKHELKSAYARNATWVLNRNTMGKIRTLKDGNGQYLWMPGIAQGRPNTIDGDPYVEAPDMPSVDAGTYPVAYGDFRRAYVLGDRIAMQLLRDPFTQAANGNIRLWFRRRVGGQVVLAEAIKKLKIAAS